MRLRSPIWTVTACFGIGLGLAPLIQPAHACSCLEEGYWRLAFASVNGPLSADADAEAERWATDASFAAAHGGTLTVGYAVTLERTQ